MIRQLLLLGNLLICLSLSSNGEEELLDPSEMLKPSPAIPETSPYLTAAETCTAAGGAVLRPERLRDDSSTARSMAARVTSALNGLVSAGSNLALKIQVLKADMRTKEDLLQKHLSELEAKLNEFRAGEFFSGCNKTKSEIHATKNDCGVCHGEGSFPLPKLGS